MTDSSHENGREQIPLAPHNTDKAAPEQSGQDLPESDESTALGHRFRAPAWFAKGTFLRELVTIVASSLLLMFLLNNFVFHTYVIPSESMEDTLNGCTGCRNDRIAIDQLTYHFRDPHPGDVVVFAAPNDSWKGLASFAVRSRNGVISGIQDIASHFGLQPPKEYALIKRVIAVGGQQISCSVAQGGILVDGKPIHEPYLSAQAQQARVSEGPCWSGAFGAGNALKLDGEFGPITVPQGSVFVMGDNRSDSADSRFHLDDGNFGCIPVKDIHGIARWVIYPFSRLQGIGQLDPQQH